MNRMRPRQFSEFYFIGNVQMIENKGRIRTEATKNNMTKQQKNNSKIHIRSTLPALVSNNF